MSGSDGDEMSVQQANTLVAGAAATSLAPEGQKMRRRRPPRKLQKKAARGGTLAFEDGACSTLLHGVVTDSSYPLQSLQRVVVVLNPRRPLAARPSVAAKPSAQAASRGVVGGTIQTGVDHAGVGHAGVGRDGAVQWRAS